MSIAEDLDRDGFAIVRDVLSPEEAKKLRSDLKALFETPAVHAGDYDNRGRLGSVRLDVIARHPQFWWVLCHANVLAVLREVLGHDFVYLPETGAHRAGYGDWHKDTSSQERAGKTFHWTPGYLMVEAAFYVQENTREYGGGLEVIPGSHRLPDTYANNPDKTIFDKVRTKLKAALEPWGIGAKKGAYLIPSRPGDLVLFDFRLDHRASPASCRDIPEDKTKYALFLACSKNTHHVDAYLDHIRSRPDYTYINEPYPAELLELARRENIRLIRGRT